MSITRYGRKGKFLDLTKKGDFHTFRLYLLGIVLNLLELFEQSNNYIQKSPVQEQSDQNQASDFFNKGKEAMNYEIERTREKELNQVKLSELKTESTRYFESLYNSETIQQRFPKFNKEKFRELSYSIDKNGKQSAIPQEYNDLMKGIVLSESCMDKGAWYQPSRSIREHMYVFGVDGTPKGITNLIKTGYDYYGEHRKGKKKYPRENALGEFQMQTGIFTKLICNNEQLRKKVIQIIKQDFSKDPLHQEIITILEGIGVPKLEDRYYNIIHHPGMLNIMQQLSFNMPLVQQVEYAFLKNNEQTIKNNYKDKGIYFDHQDMLLTCGLAHLKGPSGALDAVLQQNVYLLAQSLGIDIKNILGTNKPYHIDGMIKMPGKKSMLVDDSNDSDPKAKTLQSVPTDGGETWKVFQAIKIELEKKGLHIFQNVELDHMIPTKGSDCRNNMIVRFQDCEKQLKGKGIPYNFEPLLSVCDLKLLQETGGVQLRYIFHYLESLQCDPVSEKQKKIYRKKMSDHKSTSTERIKKNNPNSAINGLNNRADKKALKINQGGNTIKSPIIDNEQGDKGAKKNSSTNDLTFRRFHEQFAELNKEGELVQGNISGLNRIKLMYTKQAKNGNGNSHWSEADIENNTRLQNVVTYKDIFNDHIKSNSTVVFDKDKIADSDYVSSTITSLVDNAGGDIENIIVGFRKAAKVMEVIKNTEGKYMDMIVALPYYDKTLGHYVIKNLSVFGKGGMIEQHGHVYAAVLNKSFMDNNSS